jgi:hypothetical protein
MIRRSCSGQRQRWASAVLALALSTVGPPTRADAVRRYVVTGSVAPGEHEVALWDARLRRWLEDRRVPAEARVESLGSDLARPWRELLEGTGRPWERLGGPLARERAVAAAWASFRGGRRDEAVAILAAAARRGSAATFAVPWDWADAEAFGPLADAFATQLREASPARCHWSGDASEERWLDGAVVEGAAAVGDGTHATARRVDGGWRFGALRCDAAGKPVVVEATSAMAFLAASDRSPAIVTFWEPEGLRVAWLGQSVVQWMADGPIDRSVALDAGGGPLTGLRLPSVAESLRAPVAGQESALRVPRAPEAGEARSGTPSWLWIALGAAVVAGGGVWLSQRENARHAVTVPVQWD